MIYIYVEDKIEGLLLMRNAVELYMHSADVKVDTYNGIFNLIEHIKHLNVNANDAIYYIYDDIPGNTDVPGIVKNANRLIQKLHCKNINMIPILCCEYEVLTAQYIEFFIHRNSVKWVRKLKEYGKDELLTENTKKEPLFTCLYDRARKEQERKLKSKQNKTGIKYTTNDIDRAVTVEKLCKKLFSEAFPNELSITENFGDCWEKNCCIKTKRICCMNNTSRLLRSHEKKQFLVDYTVYRKIIDIISANECIQKEPHNQIEINNIHLIKSIQNIIDKLNKIFNANVIMCKSNLESYIQDGYTLEKAIELCKNDKFTDKHIEEAIKRLHDNI